QLQPGGRALQNGGSGAELYLSVSQRVRLTQQGEKRKRAVRAEVAEDAAARAVVLREARQQIAQRWLSRWSTQELASIAQRDAELAAETAQKTQAALAAGEATRVDLAQIEGWRAEAGLLALSAEGSAFDSGVELARALGLPGAAPLGAAAELPSIDLPEQAA